jgi:calcineurin-like phosphoesterase family protein
VILKISREEYTVRSVVENYISRKVWEGVKAILVKRKSSRMLRGIGNQSYTPSPFYILEDIMKEFFISDTHFGHTNIIKYENRPFNTVGEMDEYIIKQWNSVVSDGDLVYHLGDFFLTYTDRQMEIFDRLDGDIILIRGNHDRQSDTKLIERIGFKEVHDEYYLMEDGMVTLLTHRPILNLAYMDKNEIDFNLHGHKHSVENQYSDRHINLSVENINYTPVDRDYLRDNYGYKKV